MVMPLPEPEDSSKTLIAEVVRERQNGRNAKYFSSIQKEWEERVDSYILNKGSPQHVKTWDAITPARKTSFLNLYLSSPIDTAHGKVIGKLEARRKKMNLCPACGEPGTPNTLDHYLPKGKYPHFCITPLNLYPMCDICQQEKLEKTGSAAEPRFFLHPYYDVFLAEQVLHIDIIPPFSSPTFNLVFSPRLTAEQRLVVASHVRELDIEERFAHYFRDQSIRAMRLAAERRSSGLSVREFIESWVPSIRKPTQNSWEHVFWAAVLANAPMMDFLENGPLPDNI